MTAECVYECHDMTAGVSLPSYFGCPPPIYPQLAFQPPTAPAEKQVINMRRWVICQHTSCR